MLAQELVPTLGRYAPVGWFEPIEDVVKAGHPVRREVHIFGSRVEIPP